MDFWAVTNRPEQNQAKLIDKKSPSGAIFFGHGNPEFLIQYPKFNKIAVLSIKNHAISCGSTSGQGQDAESIYNAGFWQ
ncbi:hypothetical protein CFter6_4042 [Collimonas fungivorans]|uniref:Uncharacterized protein n=1 Tax=Collimonas fungivorans TaxID=158899 RepID=A0A127PGW0_9BURK|nr:hypothetical protein [Collimonas fungivorans]AMO96651.1 hypothetical protein CFter6_4042 [Collimonas fungivorans]